MEHTELPHRHGNDRDLSRLEHCMQEAESFQAVAGLCRLLSDANRVRIFWLLCHCEECVVNLAALVGMSSPAASHHLRQLKDSGLVVSRRIGKEVYYRAADTEVAGLLHQVIERTVEVTCPREEAMPHAPHLPPVDAHAGEHAADLTPQQREIIHQVHQLLTENLDSRITIEQLSRRFLMNPSTMKELFKAEYGSSIAAHIRQHRMEKASALLLESGDSLAQVARAVGYESQSKFSAEFKKVFGMLPSASMTVHPVRMSGLMIAAPQSYRYFERVQESIVSFVARHSRITQDDFRQLMLADGDMSNDVGTILYGSQAVQLGLIDRLGTLSDALEALYGMIGKNG